MTDPLLLQKTKDRLLQEVRHHLKGWKVKANDLAKEGYDSEIASLEGDPVYTAFGLATGEYALIRLMGRLSISIGRRLGEIYDKIPRFVTQARFDLDAASVAPKLPGRLELDCCVPIQKLSEQDLEHVRQVSKNHLDLTDLQEGLAIEIRYNFNPNDSSRLRKDVQVAELLQEDNYHPLYLVFSTISPRDEAIARLTRAGWRFLVGPAASQFMYDLIGMDIEGVLATPEIRDEVQSEMTHFMNQVYKSHAVATTLLKYAKNS